MLPSPPLVNLTVTKIEDYEEGYICFHQKAHSYVPFVADRSIMITYYTVQNDENDFIFMTSTEVNEHLCEKYKNLIGTDVVLKLIVNYMKVESKFD